MQATGTHRIGSVAGLPVTANSSALLAAVLLWVALAAIGLVLLRFTPVEALLLSLAAVIVHWASVIVHQLGHAWAAHSTGHPMSSIHLWGLLSSSVYPSDESELPRAVHMRRAMGGPILSTVFMLLALALLLIVPATSPLRWLALFFFLDNLLVFSLGAFLPLGFTDGSTLLGLFRSPH